MSLQQPFSELVCAILAINEDDDCMKLANSAVDKALPFAASDELRFLHGVIGLLGDRVVFQIREQARIEGLVEMNKALADRPPETSAAS